MSDTTPKGLAAKMALAMAEIGRVQKRGHNTAQDYKFVRSDDVAEVTRAVLSKLGIAMFADVVEDSLREIVIPPAKEGYAGKTLRVSRVRVAWTFKDADTGEERTVHTPGEGMDSGDKGIYKAMTGAMKYALMLGFLIPTGDADPEKATDADEVYQGDKPASRVEGLKAKVAAKVNGGTKMPATPEARKMDLKARLAALGVTAPSDMAATLSEWIGRTVDGATVISGDDWMKADAGIADLKAKEESLAKARLIAEQPLN